MTEEPRKDTSGPHTDVPGVEAMAEFQRLAFGPLSGLGTAWIEKMGDVSAEMMSFLTERLKEDVRLQHRLMHCKDVEELQRAQLDFVQKALAQYSAETGKLVNMGSDLMGALQTERKV